jgi:hypothetical protein
MALGSRDDRGEVLTTWAWWDGSDWTQHSSYIGVRAHFNRVACPSAAFCVAVGSKPFKATTELAGLVWRHSQWRHVTFVKFPAGTDYVLRDVSCRGVGSCVAVGSYRDEKGVKKGLYAVGGGPFSESNEWSAGSVPLPQSASSSWLTAVSCHARGCWAFGAAKVGRGELNLGDTEILHDNPRVDYLGSPPSGALTAIDGLSCSSGSTTGSTACAAVGHYRDSAGAELPQSVVFSDGLWGPRLPAAAGTNGVLDRVSCTGPAACQAVGYRHGPDGRIATIERWNGTEWALER